MIRRTKFCLLLVLFIINTSAKSQLYFTKNGNISFYSKTILENIQAENNQVISVLNIQTGIIEFSLLNIGFHFPKAKMEEDFNENYMESDQYPRSTFKGTIADIDKIDFTKDGSWQVNVNGELMIHGIKKNISVPGKIIIKDGKISAKSTFKILIQDFKIRIPTIVSNKISEEVETTIDCQYEKK
jgi:hypothetical protein